MSQWRNQYGRNQMMDNKFIESVRDFMRQAEQAYHKNSIPFDSEIFEYSESVRVTESKKIPGYTLAEERVAVEFLEILFVAKKMNFKLASAVIALLTKYDVK